MKKNTLFILWISLSMLLITACRKTTNWVSDETAANVLFESLEQNAGGLANETILQTIYLDNHLQGVNCSEEVVVNRNFTYTAGERTASSDYEWIITKVCENNDISLSWVANFIGEYDFPRAKGSWVGQRNWEATNVNAQETYWTLNGTSNRSGAHEFKINRRRTFDSKVETTFFDLRIDKNTRQIIGGGAYAVITITPKNGNPFMYNAVCYFYENGTVRITVDEGSSFVFNLY